MNRDFLSAKLQEIKSRFESGKHPIIAPVWEIKIPNLLSSNSDDKYRFQLVKEIPLNFLLNNLHESYLSLFNQKILFNYRLKEYKVCNILSRWDEGLPIDPPTLIWNEHLDKIQISNGIHRVNTAIIMGAKKLPAVIPNKDYLKIYPLLLESSGRDYFK
ncbi:MAG: hypothetical protein RLO81_02770 [Fulvivirga sp.]|uniref:hypothetical protein n=1 Tax=Fulvivirga sp. TaxID=1931237 RepID=UPI0032ECF63D